MKVMATKHPKDARTPAPKLRAAPGGRSLFSRRPLAAQRRPAFFAIGVLNITLKDHISISLFLMYSKVTLFQIFNLAAKWRKKRESCFGMPLEG